MIYGVVKESINKGVTKESINKGVVYSIGETMGENHFPKQPWEKFTVYGDFTNVLNDGDTIDVDNSSVTVEDSAGTDVTSDIVVAGSVQVSVTYPSRLTVMVQGGTEDGSIYTITYKITTVAGEKYEVEQLMFVEDTYS